MTTQYHVFAAEVGDQGGGMSDYLGTKTPQEIEEMMIENEWGDIATIDEESGKLVKIAGWDTECDDIDVDEEMRVFEFLANGDLIAPNLVFLSGPHKLVPTFAPGDDWLEAGFEDKTGGSDGE